jgi:hypothetical protein
MECLAVFLVLVILIGVTMTFASQAHAGAERWSRAFLNLARKHGGWYTSGGWFGRPSVRFYYGGTMAVVESLTVGRSRRRYLQIRMNFPEPKFRCEAFPRRLEARTPLRGMADSRTGFHAFDTEYTLRCDQESEGKRFFSDGVQLQLNRIRYLLGNDDVYLSVYLGLLLIKKEFPRHASIDQIEDIVQFALELYDQAMLTRTTAIEFLEHQTLSTIDQCVCMVCGEELIEDVVLCRRCKTPHHRDCWAYYGACSTYGCKEAEFVIPRVAQPRPDPPHSETPATRD